MKIKLTTLLKPLFFTFILILSSLAGASKVQAASCNDGVITATPDCTCDGGRHRFSHGGQSYCRAACADGQQVFTGSYALCFCPAATHRLEDGKCVMNTTESTETPPNSGTDQVDSPGITNPVIGVLGNDPEQASEGTTFVQYFIILWQALITVGGIMVLIFFVWGALEWILAGGDSGKIQKARDRITQSIIGLIILVASFTLVSFISNLFFGESFNLLNFTIPTAGTSTAPGS